MRIVRYAALLAVSLVGARATAVGYHFTDLGVLGGGFSSRAFDVNSGGLVVGQADTGVFDHGFQYVGGSMTDMGTFGGQEAWATAINSSGTIVGYSDAGGFLFANGQGKQIGSLGGGASTTVASDINDAGSIVGYSNTAGGNQHAFIYNGGSFTDLGTLAGDDQSQANGVNALGDVVGSSASAAHPNGEAFLYSGGVMTGLGTLGGDSSRAFAVNDSGMVVGSFAPAGQNEQQAFVYENGQMTAIVGVGSFASDVNNLGQVVGFSTGGAFLYQNGTAVSLASLVTDGSANGYTMYAGYGITDNGYICGFAVTPSGSEHAFLLSPVPEPQAVVGLTASVVGLAVRRRRKTR